MVSHRLSEEQNQTHSQYPQIPLSSQCPQHDCPYITVPLLAFLDVQTFLGLLDSLTSQLPHLVVLIQLPRELLRVGIVSEGGNEGVGDHDGLEMKSTVADVAERVS